MRYLGAIGDVVQNASIFDKINPLKPFAPDVPVQDQAAFAAIGNALVTMTAQGQEAALAMVAASDGGQIEYRRNIFMTAGFALLIGAGVGYGACKLLGSRR